MRRTDDEFSRAKQLCDRGHSDYAVARALGLPRSTVQRWRQLERRKRRWVRLDPGWRPRHPEQYCYLLGIYLGDGHIVTAGASASLRVTLDSLYPAIVEEVSTALAEVFAPARPRRYLRRPARLTIVQLSQPSLVVAFPQHGPGRKHLRKIQLDPWQLALTEEYPQALLRGLIHSDGARCINRFGTMLPSGRIAHYEYPRYFFSNLSADIREIFCAHCDLLGVRWTQSNHRNISIAHRESVARLDGFIGAKS